MAKSNFIHVKFTGLSTNGTENLIQIWTSSKINDDNPKHQMSSTI